MASTARSGRRRPTREQTSERVLEAAAWAFSRHGYDAASLDVIAARAGLTKGAIYSSFGSKDRLFLEVLDRRAGERVEAARAIAHDDEARAALGELLAGFTAVDPTWHRAFLEFWAWAMRSDGATVADLATRRQTLRTAIASVLRAHGEIEPERLAIIVLALSNGLAVERGIDADAVEGTFSLALSRLLRV